MLWYLAFILAVATLFYLAIPGIGAFLVRGRWRLFRSTIHDVSRYPMLIPRAFGRERNEFVGYFRFFGTLEAIQGEDRIWITNGATSVAADLKKLNVYMLPAAQTPDQERMDTDLRAVPWSRIFSLPEGTTILVGGALFCEDGRGVFRTRSKQRPLVVFHDCKRENIIQRAIWGGRHRNEYWNQFTFPSLITGAFCLFVIAYLLLGLKDQRLSALAALAACFAPMSPFLPPAFPFYFLYRRYWKTARLMRAQRDVVMLPMRYFPPTVRRNRPEAQPDRRATLLPDLEPYIMLRGMKTAGENQGFVSVGETVALPADTMGITVTLPRLWRKRTGEDGQWSLFGAYSDEGDRISLRRPQDPMAELTLIPGDPEELSRDCGKAARLFELVAFVFIVLNIVVNIAALFLLLARVVG
jgi:hypothetical protein